MSSLNVQLVAADRKVWEGDAKEISCRTVAGELGILPGHAPLLSVLDEGDLIVDPVSGQRSTVTIDGGFISVDSDKVTIVAEVISGTVGA
ncbi:F0F1 ATP synthase subunit epsilon [Leekyejoonella antrihumi]|uniref:ATP synthase epsilon chain n=1 Tax=Leekyejoonella antrihumi TaxID=1660198 RepID=A0A563E1V5_9MICO|nr:F0F1 ATP synthase subunit epsilon [Leekyejoonella antrihumi]TWP36517.1 F0F1 ATP synthase subunit epsilon [Leekyejoonella antrihumi]